MIKLFVESLSILYLLIIRRYRILREIAFSIDREYKVRLTADMRLDSPVFLLTVRHTHYKLSILYSLLTILYDRQDKVMKIDEIRQ